MNPIIPTPRIQLVLSLLCALLPGASRLRAQALPGPAVTGRVQDTTGAIIPNARVELQRLNGSILSFTQTDSAGNFSLALPVSGPAGENDHLTVARPGFEPLVRTLHLARTPPAAITLVLNPATVDTTVDVNAGEAVAMADPDNNQDAATISTDDMKTLPILDGDVVATLSAFLDAGAAGEGGASLIVDGVEMKTAGVAPSAIDRVSINQDPYSAQYKQPGRGQVEVVTRSNSDKFHGSANLSLRDSIFDATNYFATSKPPDQRIAFEGFLSGPIKPFRNTTFLSSGLVQHQNAYEQIVANKGTDPITGQPITPGNVLSAWRNYNLTTKVAHQISDRHSAYLLYRFFDTMRTNRNTGGLNLASAGYTQYNFDMDITFHDDIAFASNKFNAFSILVERNIDRQVSNTQFPSVVVQGAFQGGGAQADQLQTENNPNISDIVSWSVGGGAHPTHQLKFGLQFPNLGRRVLEDTTNRQGTYTFGAVPNCTPTSPADTHCSPLMSYASKSPTTFTIQQGQTRFLTHYDQPSAFFLDQIQATARLTITPGVRYDFQNALPNTKDAILPRLSFAYLLDKDHSMVLRTGAGLYMRKVGVNLSQQLARYQNAVERSLLITNITQTGCYPDMTTCYALAAQPPSLYIDEPNLKAPFQGFFGVSIEREVTKKSTLTIGYEGYRGWHALQSVDINAPLPPFTSSARPNPNFSQVLEQRSGGVQRSDSMVVSYRGRISNVFSGFLQYTYGHADSNTQWSDFIPQNQYKPNDEWSRSDTDQRHRANLIGTFFPDKPLTFGFGVYAYSAAPYTITTGKDDYYTGVLNARPAGVPRNSLNGGSFQDFQTRVTYTRKLRPRLKDASPTMAFYVQTFNALNRANFEDYVGVITSADFMHPTSASNPRRFQLGVSYNF